MIASFDYYNRFEEPIISLCSPDDAFMGFVPNVKNLTISPEFNAVSEMSCDVYQYNNGSADVDKDAEAKLLQVYEDIQVKRQLFVEGIGFFIINDVSEKKDENGEYKSLSLLSCEHELSYKKLTYFNGTYPFWNEASPEESLMGMLLSSLPRWSMGHVDTKVAERYRTFEEPDTTVYSFLMDDVEDSYECLFDFDIINRTINVYDKNSYIRKTSVFLSRKDVIGSLSIDTRSEQVYTALSLYGDGEITYRGINPLGGAAVYNFAYYKSWMSEGLQAALTAWEETVAAAETSVAALRTQLSNRNTELQTIQSNMDSIQEQITLLEKQLGVNTLSPDVITSLTAQIKQKKTELSETQKSYDEKYGEIQAINRQLSTIYDACNFSNNFTEEQLTELDAYIYEASEVDDTFAFTDDMSYEEQEEILTGLYQKAKSMLADISVPTEELSLDTNNFIFQKEFLPYTEQLNTGSIIDVEISDGVCVSYVLLKLDVNYSDKSVKLTLGNKYRTSNAEALWSSWQSNVSKSSTTLTYERSKYGKAVNSGSLDEMNRFMKSSLDLTLNQVKASDGQSIEISDSGLKGRRLNPETGEADKEQLWMTANNIVFTDDNWDTVKTAIGRLVMPDGTQGYGVNAEYLMGKWILGNGMVISNANGSFTINEDGIQSSYYDSEIEEVKSAAQQTEEKMNNLQIGGRNLARGTSVNYSAPFTNFNGGTNKTINLGKVYTTGLSVGDVITVHLYYQYEDIVAATGQETKVYIQGNGDVTGWAYGAFAGCPTIHPTGSGEYEFLYSIAITEDRLKNSYWSVNIRHDYVQSGSVRYKMFKVEKGNKATDWTPAPEDTEGEISGLKETVTTQGTEISAIQGQISSKIWQQDITTAVDNLQVGGRNLLLNSNVFYTRTNDAQTGSGKSFYVSAEALKSLIGKTVTESFYLYSPGRRDTSLNENVNLSNRFGCHLAFTWRKSNDPSGATKVTYPGLLLAISKEERGRVSTTVTVSPPEGYDVLYNATLSLQQYAKPADANIEWEIGYPKLEIGDKATDWTPAPEDTEGKLDALNTKYSEINQTVDGISATVASHTTEIAAKADQSEVSEVSDKVAQLEINVDGFKSEVSASYATKEEFNNLQIGGRNLILHSDDLEDSKYWVAVNGSVQKGYADPIGGTRAVLFTPKEKQSYLVTKEHVIHEAKEHTLSVWLRAEKECSVKINFRTSNTTINGDTAVRKTVNVTTEWQRYTVTAMINEENITHTGGDVWFGQGDVTPFYIALPKLEVGNKATDWTPAPEDMEGELDALNTKYSEINQTVDGISATVASHTTEIAAKADQSEVSEVSDKVAQLEINVDGFKSEVSASYATKEDFNNLQVGGRNLLFYSDLTDTSIKNSQRNYSCGSYGASSQTITSEGFKVVGGFKDAMVGFWVEQAELPMRAGETYTFSMDIKGDLQDGTGDFGFCYTDSSSAGFYYANFTTLTNVLDKIDSNLFKRVSVTYTIPEKATDSCSPALIIGTGKCYIKNVMLEKATTPSNWTPAPEDTEEQITEVKTIAEQTADKFNWIVKSGTSETDFTLTDRTADLVAEQINLKGLVSFSGLDKDAQNEINQAITTANSAKGQATHVQGAIMDWCMNNDVTYINGGKIYTGSITASQIAAGAITADKIAVKDLSALNAKLGGWSVTSTAISQSHTAADGKTYTVNVSNYSNDNADSRVFHCSTNGTDTFSVRRNGQVNCSNIIATGGKVGGWSIASSSLSKTATYNGVDYNVLINGAPNSADSGAIIVRSKGSGETTWQNKFYVRYSGFMKATDADITGKITATSGKIGGFYIGENCLKSTSLAASSGGTGLYIFSTPEDIDLNGDGNTIKSYMAVAYNGHWEMCLSTSGSFRYRTHTGTTSLNETASLE